MAKTIGETFEIEDKSVEDILSLAKAAEQAERYEDMTVFMKALVSKRLKKVEGNATESVLDTEQRNLFSVAYKNVVGTKRTAWRHLTEGLEKEDSKELLSQYINAVAVELQNNCNEILKQLFDLSHSAHKTVTANKTTAAEGTAAQADKPKSAEEDYVFYLKMIGDYYRYLVEAFKDDDKCKSKCKEAYKKAYTMAEKELEPTNSTRLGLALNYSVCYYEILDEKEEACKLAKDAFDQAIEKLDSLNDSSYKDSTLIMQLLRDNLTIWNGEKDTAATKEEAADN